MHSIQTVNKWYVQPLSMVFLVDRTTVSTAAYRRYCNIWILNAGNICIISDFKWTYKCKLVGELEPCRNLA